MAGRKLAEYERKRRRSETPEPFGSGKPARAQPIFVVQRHDARRLHYDFRLERDGALASWAVPKGVPLEPGQQHLAVHVEDHPLDYADFEGEIPKGNYGAGLVEIWDKGTYELVEEKPNGGLTVRLHGQRLEGTWALVPAKLSGDEKNWLLLRKRDEAAPAKGSPRRYTPMLATLSAGLPAGDGWLHEVKWDGYRALAYLHGAEVALVSRNGNDLTQRFESVAKEVAEAPPASQMGHRAVRHDAVHPCLERRLLSESGDPPEHPEVRLLRHVLGVGAVVHEPVRQAVDAPMGQPDQLFERETVTLPAPLDELRRNHR